MVLVIVGSLIALLGVIEFRKAKTTVDPRTPDKAENLVVSGVYQVSRNPMYLGFLIILLSWAFYLDNGATFLILPIFVAYMSKFQIVPEERYMSAKFGKEFSDYCSKVRRWI
ncbi:methyltransferase family protein [Amphritea sp. HPY]|uniref:methyltransferase family protein n=1 Tax=Amphritea sp. HPY TaxID=3421652 RepID=UPI003D7E8048